MDKLTDERPRKTTESDRAERETARQFTRANVIELENAALRDALTAWTKTHGATDWDCKCNLCVKSRVALSSSAAA